MFLTSSLWTFPRMLLKMKNNRRLLICILALQALLVKANNIEFADPNIKFLCVTNWDVDGDGELSVEEAAAVNSLGTVFKGQKAIGTFHELCFFTGLSCIGDEAFYQSSLKGVTFPSSVVEIGKRAFAETQLGSEVSIPGTVKVIRSYAFSKCSQIRDVILGEGVEQVYTEAFTGEIHFMVLPSSITYFAPEAVIPYTTFGFETRSYVFHLRVTSESPVNVEYSAFRQLFGEGVLIVPSGSAGNYISSTKWQSFSKVLDLGDVNGDGALNVADIAALVAYVTGNTPKTFNEYAADFNGDGKIDAKDIELLTQYILTTPSSL